MDKQDDQENKRHQSKEEEEQESQILIPIVQETILFHGKPLVVVRLPNGEPGVVLRWICENLHLDTQGQVQRIQRTEVIAGDLVYTRVQTEGGPQVMPTLILFSVPYWLATIDTRRMDKNDERRLEILDYQRNAVAALYAWAQSPKGEGTPPAWFHPNKSRNQLRRETRLHSMNDANTIVECLSGLIGKKM